MDKGLIVDSAGLLSGTFAKLQKRQLDKLCYVPPLCLTLCLSVHMELLAAARQILKRSILGSFTKIG